MTTWPLFPRGVPIRLQIIVLLIATQLLAHAATVFVVRIGTGGFDEKVPEGIAADSLAPLTTVLGITFQLPTAEAADVLRAATDFDARLTLEAGIEPQPEDDINVVGRRLLSSIRDSFPELPPERVAVAEAAIHSFWPFTIGNYKLAVELDDGTWLTFTPSRDTFVRIFPLFVLLLATTVLAVPLAAFSIWAGGTLVAPLRRLAGAAQRFGVDLHAEPATETGPAEVRAVARTFNTMRERLRSMVEARAFALAAISHDLRTPLTRLRLRIHALSADTDRDRLLNDVGAMENMINSALTYIRNEGTPLTRQKFDLSALVQTICDDADEGRQAVWFDGPDRLTMTGDPDRIGRAIANILANAMKYAGNAEVSLQANAETETVTLTIADNGPGIPVNDREVLFDPFRRGDEARAGDRATGFGLGLSIARDIVERHHGTIRLSDNPPMGLKVTIELPTVEG